MIKVNLHIYQKVIITFLFLVGPIYFISVWISILGSRYLEKEILNTTMLNISFYSKHFDDQFEFIKKQQLQLVNNSDVQNLNFDPTDIIAYRDVETTARIMKSIATSRDSSIYIENAGVFIKPVNKTFSFYEGINNIPNKEFDIIRDHLLDGRQNSIVDFVEDRIYMSEVYPQNAGKDFQLSKIVAYYEIDREMIEDTLRQIITTNNSGAVLSDDNLGRIISYRDDEEFINKIDKAKMTDIIKKGSMDKFYSKIDGKGYWIICNRIKMLNMNLIAYVSVDEVTKHLKGSNYWLVILSIASIIIIVVFSFSINIMIHKPMEKFKRAFKELQSDNFDISISHKSNDEFGYLYKSFNTTVERLKLSINENYQQKIALQQSELKQLQSQINPHFLYNSFFNIYRMCKSENYDGVAMLTQKLGSYYQFITRSGADEVPFQMEFRHAMDYVEIQSIRFANRIKVFTGELPEECKNLMVPKIILQPVIENAFEHGFEDKLEGGNIYMDIKFQDNTLVITVEDDGNPLDGEAFLNLKHKLENAGEAEEKTGLINVCNRIRLKYGEQSGLTAGRSPYGGIKISIIIKYSEKKYK